MALPRTPNGEKKELGRYALTRDLSSSSVGASYVARGPDEQEVLLHKVNRGAAKPPSLVQSLIAAAETAKNLQHKNVLAVVDSGMENGEPFFVTENSGIQLPELLQLVGESGLPIPIAMRISLDLFEAGKAAHALAAEAGSADSMAVGHGEFGPWAVQVGTDGVSRVSGFGIDQQFWRFGAHYTKNMDRLAYAAPERVRALSTNLGGEPPAITEASDLFSVSVLVFELLTKHRLFGSKMEAAVVQKVLTHTVPSAATLRPEIAAPIAETLRQALSRDKKDRLASFEKVIEGFAGAASSIVAPAKAVAEFIATARSAVSGGGATVASAASASKGLKVGGSPGLGAAGLAQKPGTAGAGALASSAGSITSRRAAAAPMPSAGLKGGPLGAAKRGTTPNPQPAVTAAAAPTPTPGVATAGLAGKGAIRSSKTLLGFGATKPGQSPNPPATGSKAESTPSPGQSSVGNGNGNGNGNGVAKTPISPFATRKPSGWIEAVKPPSSVPPESFDEEKTTLDEDLEPAKLPPVAAQPVIAPSPVSVGRRAAATVEGVPGNSAAALAAARAAAHRTRTSTLMGIQAPDEAEIAAAKRAYGVSPAAGRAADVPEPKKPPPPVPARAATSLGVGAPLTPAAKAAAANAFLREPSAVQEKLIDKPTIPAPVPTKQPLVMGSAEDLRPGSTLEAEGKEYELILPVARGGMAVVWAGREATQGPVLTVGESRMVAVKTMLPELAEEDDFEHMFLDEARVAARIRHKNVAGILGLGMLEDMPFLVMEWVDGETLSTIQQGAKTTGGIPFPVILRIAAETAAGLHAAHEVRDSAGTLLELVHRDVSPANILVSQTGVVKVVDFGIAKSKGRLHMTRAGGQVKGKTPYLSPEQIGGLPVDRRSDLFSLGVLLYVLSTGKHPFRGETEIQTLENIAIRNPPIPSELVPDIDPEFEALILKLLDKDARKRHPTAEALEQDLREMASKLERPAGQLDVAELVRSSVGEKLDARQRKLESTMVTLARISGDPGAATPPPSVASAGIRSPGLDAPQPSIKGAQMLDEPTFDPGAPNGKSTKAVRDLEDEATVELSASKGSKNGIDDSDTHVEPEPPGELGLFGSVGLPIAPSPEKAAGEKSEPAALDPAVQARANGAGEEGADGLDAAIASGGAVLIDTGPPETAAPLPPAGFEPGADAPYSDPDGGFPRAPVSRSAGGGKRIGILIAVGAMIGLVIVGAIELLRPSNSQNTGASASGAKGSAPPGKTGAVDSAPPTSPPISTSPGTDPGASGKPTPAGPSASASANILAPKPVLVPNPNPGTPKPPGPVVPKPPVKPFNPDAP